MTATAPPLLDWLHLKMESEPCVISVPLCEVIDGTYRREENKHIIECGKNVAEFDQIKFSAFLEIQFAYLGKIQYWMIQQAGQEQTPLLKGFLEKFS